MQPDRHMTRPLAAQGSLHSISEIALKAGLALMAIVSLHPYLLWSHQKPAYAVATILIIASCAGSLRILSFGRDRLLLSVAFSLFLLYLSVLPKVHGGVTRWYLLIPFVVALIHLRREDLRDVFALFHWTFALSLVPGMVLSLWLLAGLPVEVGYLTPPADIVQRGVTEYGEFPGAIFLLSNAVVLPHGGVLSRLCGIYDEPGTVGTIAALCLAATRFRIGDIKGALSFAGGVMSFSIAFSILTAIGLAATAITARRPSLLAAAALCVVVGWIPLSGLNFEGAPVSNVTVVTPSQNPSAAEMRERFVPYPTWRLRNSPEIDNRAQPWMRKMFDDYWAAPMRSILFGIASDASVVHGWGSSVWYRVLTDFGIVGFAWVFVLYSYPLLVLWREKRLDAPVLIFCTLFLMSFYQRPIIWLPAQLLIYLAGVTMIAEPIRSRPERPVEDAAAL